LHSADLSHHAHKAAFRPDFSNLVALDPVRMKFSPIGCSVGDHGGFLCKSVNGLAQVGSTGSDVVAYFVHAFVDCGAQC